MVYWIDWRIEVVIEFIIFMEVFRGFRDIVESVRDFFFYNRIVEGLGSMEGGSRIVGLLVYWEGIGVFFFL